MIADGLHDRIRRGELGAIVDTVRSCERSEDGSPRTELILYFCDGSYLGLSITAEGRLWCGAGMEGGTIQ